MAARSRLTIRVLGADGWRSHSWTAEVDPSDRQAVRAEVRREAARWLAGRLSAGVQYELAVCARPEEVH